MLADHGISVRRRAEAALRRRQTLADYGAFLKDLAPWIWVMTITLRDRPAAAHPPGRHAAFAAVEEFLDDLERAAWRPIAWIIVEDTGSVGGRKHFHLLIAGVGHLDLGQWRDQAFKRFGRTEILPYVASRGAAYYLAKRALSERGDLRFGGRMFDVDVGSSDSRDMTPSVVRGLREVRDRKTLGRPSSARVGVGDFDRSATKQESAPEDLEAPRRAFERLFAYGRGTGAAGTASAYAWVIESTGEGTVKAVRGLTKPAAEYSGIIAGLEQAPAGAFVEVVCTSPLVTWQFSHRCDARPRKLLVLLKRVRQLIRDRRLRVVVICGPWSLNAAWRLLRTATQSEITPGADDAVPGQKPRMGSAKRRGAEEGAPAERRVRPVAKVAVSAGSGDREKSPKTRQGPVKAKKRGSERG